ncbi:MAG TPA: hypothetical protein VGS21_08095 [Acidimicrobiales bacterium]|nr:hypothetical protein [Acidimicrobiales bacterium]
MSRFRTMRGIGSAAALTALLAALLAACGEVPISSKAPTTSSPTTTTTSSSAADRAAFPPLAGSSVIALQSTQPYTPKAPSGGTDDYHCSLVDPHLTADSYIVGSDFFPNSPEVHHAILFEVLPADVPRLMARDNGGAGWTCFGDFGIGQWLAVWAPGHGLDMAPKGTGFYFPKGSMVIMQVHYNLFAGDKPTHVRLDLQTLPAATAHLTSLQILPLPAPPDIPCPSGVTGPLCSRAASLAELGQQFGQKEIDFVNGLEQICGRNPMDPPSSDTTSCTGSLGGSGTILRIQPHMHLLGASMKVILDIGTPHARVLLDDPSYNFDYQRSFDMPAPVAVSASDTITVQCTYNPRLAQMLPQLRKVPPHFITWGNGSADEMCLAVISFVA